MDHDEQDNNYEEPTDWGDDHPNYRAKEEISTNEIMEALGSLYLLGDDPYLRMQVAGIAMVDQFIMDMEYKVLRELHETERTPPAAHFLSAQSQMWIFAVYEILRTWREQAKDVIKWAKNGGLELKIKALEKKLPYRHYGHELRASKLREVLGNPGVLETIAEDLRLTHVPFANIEHIRVSMAKHEVSGKAKSIALAPGYGRINQWCGSLEYQLESGPIIFGTISRRDIADAIRSFSDRSIIPTVEVIADFEKAMKEMAKTPPDFPI